MNTIEHGGKKYRITKDARARGAWGAYQNSDMTHICDAYKTTPSRYKIDAWDDYARTLIAPRVISTNGFMFTMGGLFKQDGKIYFAYVTKSQDVAVDVTDNGGTQAWTN